MLCRELAIFVRELGKNLKDTIYHEALLQKDDDLFCRRQTLLLVQWVLVWWCKRYWWSIWCVVSLIASLVEKYKCWHCAPQALPYPECPKLPWVLALRWQYPTEGSEAVQDTAARTWDVNSKIRSSQAKPHKLALALNLKDKERGRSDRTYFPLEVWMSHLHQTLVVIKVTQTNRRKTRNILKKGVWRKSGPTAICFQKTLQPSIEKILT